MIGTLVQNSLEAFEHAKRNGSTNGERTEGMEKVLERLKRVENDVLGGQNERAIGMAP